MRLTAMLTAILMAVSLLAAGAQADGRYGKQKVVYHINYDGGDGDKRYRGALRNIQNHINAVGAENMDVKVVLHGNGLGVLKSAKTNEQLKVAVASLKSQNVAFQVCANTLRGRKIDFNTDLFDVYQEDIVPSGVAELSHLQQQGYTYIKP
ncbi:MAG: DsrE family protein [Hyphomicrobiales bacterium]|nr:DsrE family protein [Hyphomicrobiales bacterium]MCP5370190.1 DsrE family protein [Hyphomicrobiales bacterium]